MSLPTIERLHELFACNPETGAVTRKINRGPWKAGQRVGRVSTKGYIQVYVDGTCIQLHRVIWAMCKGKWPEGQIDHINNIKDDNRLANLRVASNGENQINSGIQKNNSTGYRGVTWNVGRKKYQARLGQKSLGYYEDPEDAHKARLEAERAKYGEFARW